MKLLIIFIVFIGLILNFNCVSFSETSKTRVIDSKSQTVLTPFPNNKGTRKIIQQHEIENEGYELARQGSYEEALLKYKDSMNPSIVEEYWNKGMGVCYIEQIYKRQQKYEQALQIVEERLRLIPVSEKIDAKNIFTPEDDLQREKLELQALIKARDTKKNKPIYDYIDYLRTKSKYSNLLPPDGKWSDMTTIIVNDIIHLYDAINDVDGGMQFMEEIISYRQKRNKELDAKRTAEYARVKRAWELDKQTGQHGHLQDVIKTSDIISW